MKAPFGLIWHGKSPFAIWSCILHGRTRHSTLRLPHASIPLAVTTVMLVTSPVCVMPSVSHSAWSDSSLDTVTPCKSPCIRSLDASLGTATLWHGDAAQSLRRLSASGTSLSHPGVLSLSCQVSCVLHGWTHHSTLSHPVTSQISLTRTYLVGAKRERRRTMITSPGHVPPGVATVTAGGHGASRPAKWSRPDPRDRNGLTPGSGPRSQMGGVRGEAAGGRGGAEKTATQSQRQIAIDDANCLTGTSNEHSGGRSLESRQRGEVIRRTTKVGIKGI